MPEAFRSQCVNVKPYIIGKIDARRILLPGDLIPSGLGSSFLRQWVAPGGAVAAIAAQWRNAQRSAKEVRERNGFGEIPRQSVTFPHDVGTFW